MIDAEQALDSITGHTAAEVSFARHYRGNPKLIPVVLAAETDTAAPAVVVANHGRWIVECPDGDGDAQFASREDPRYMCTECMNRAIAGLWHLVLWPDELGAIEEALDVRPSQNQNWTPDQTVDDLIVENEENGVG